jgi:hypothetical protein
MTRTKRLTIALAIALPLLVVGGGLAVAATGAAESEVAAPSAPSLALAPVSTGTLGDTVSDGCAGQCGSCVNGTARGDCTGDCSGVCTDECEGECAIDGECTGDCGQCVVDRAGDCSGAREIARSGCGRQAADSPSAGYGCGSCDVVGLDEYPANSPKAPTSV